MTNYERHDEPEMEPATVADVLRLHEMLGTQPPSELLRGLSHNVRHSTEGYDHQRSSAPLMSQPSSMALSPNQTGVFDFRLEGDMPIVHATGSRGERAFAAWVNNHAGKFPPADMTPPIEELPTERSGEASVPPQESPMHVRVRETDEWAPTTEEINKAKAILNEMDSGASATVIGGMYSELSPEMRKKVKTILEEWAANRRKRDVATNEAPIPDYIFQADKPNKTSDATGSQEAMAAEETASTEPAKKNSVRRYTHRELRRILAWPIMASIFAGSVQVATTTVIDSYCGKPSWYNVEGAACKPLEGVQKKVQNVDALVYDRTVGEVVRIGSLAYDKTLGRIVTKLGGNK